MGDGVGALRGAAAVGAFGRFRDEGRPFRGLGIRRVREELGEDMTDVVEVGPEPQQVLILLLEAEDLGCEVPVYLIESLIKFSGYLFN